LTAKNERYDGDCCRSTRFSGNRALIVFAGGYVPYFSLATIWALYHQLKQHYGFAVIYRSRMEILRKLTTSLTALSYWRTSLAVFCLFYATFRVSGASRRPFKDTGGLCGLCSLVVMAVVSLVWLIRQVVRYSGGGPIDCPNTCFSSRCAADVGGNALPVSVQVPMVVIMMLPLHTLNITALVWFHNRKYSSSTATRARHGLAATVTGG